MNDDIILRALESLDEIISSDLINDSPIPSRILDPNKLRDWERADDFYEEIRQDQGDVHKISANIGKPLIVVSRVKEHIFYKKHKIVIDDITEFRRLDSDPEIVNSWCRLRDGGHVQQDMDLFRHEQLESILVTRKGHTQTEAHLLTINAGYQWNPDEAYNGDISDS